MRRPPRPGETILVFEYKPHLKAELFGYFAIVRCHRGMFIHFDSVDPAIYRQHQRRYARVHRFDEGQTWFRAGEDSDAAIAAYVLRQSAG